MTRTHVSKRATRSSYVVAAAFACAFGATYWLPSQRAGRGWFPVPLDDVYIHFDFARSLGQGHPFEWIPGQGYSSGETSPLYAVLLAVGWAVGFRGRALALWAALLALTSAASLVLSIRSLVRPCPRWFAWLVALLPLSIGIVDWSLFSGMEVAVFSAVLGRALEALASARDDSPRGGPTRASRQWRLGFWGAALCLLRPEAGVIVAILGIGAARGARRSSGLAALFRASLPGALATAAVLGTNLVATGDARSAGAQLKLLSSNPYLSDEERARVFVENLVTLWVKVVRSELDVVPGLAIALLVFGGVAIAGRAHRVVASAALASALAWTLLVSWNGNAPHHNFRYYVPALVLLAIAASLGLATMARAGRRRGPLAAGIFGAAMIGLFATRLPAQVRHYRAASANIRDQHIEVGARIARLSADARVLLGDAGAIPYVSNRTAIDALGLGGYRGFPFARAAVHGEASVVELIERLDPSLRPTHFALYPNWFAALTSRFGEELDRVTIEGNVICGGTSKVIYRADWSALDLPTGARAEDVVDELDVADVVDEAAHGYVAPLPHGGWTTLDVLADAKGIRRFDGGRTIPQGAAESFRVTQSAKGPLTLRMRVDSDARGIRLRTEPSRELVVEPARAGSWRTASVPLDGVRAGDVLTFEAHDGPYRDYHVWIERRPSL